MKRDFSSTCNSDQSSLWLFKKNNGNMFSLMAWNSLDFFSPHSSCAMHHTITTIWFLMCFLSKPQLPCDPLCLGDTNTDKGRGCVVCCDQWTLWGTSSWSHVSVDVFSLSNIVAAAETFFFSCWKFSWGVLSSAMLTDTLCSICLLCADWLHL